jgi:hypothetical protein
MGSARALSDQARAGAGARLTQLGDPGGAVPVLPAARRLWPGVRQAWQRLSRWFRRHYLATLVVTTGLFLLQLFHLYWLFTDVILRRLAGHSFFAFPQSGLIVYVLIDYLEIPTHLSASLLYLYEFGAGRRRRRLSWRPLVYLGFIQIHWVHILWITDDVVLQRLTQHSVLGWGVAAAWFAILIDYLEVPVILDRLWRIFQERDQLIGRLRRRFGGAPA